MSEEKSLNDYMHDFVDRMANKDPKGWIDMSNLIEESKFIEEVSAKCRATEMFQNNPDRILYLIQAFENPDIEKMLRNSWNHFVDKINNAPSSAFAIVFSILMMPIFDDLLKDLENEKNGVQGVH